MIVVEGEVEGVIVVEVFLYVLILLEGVVKEVMFVDLCIQNLLMILVLKGDMIGVEVVEDEGVDQMIVRKVMIVVGVMVVVVVGLVGMNKIYVDVEGGSLLIRKRNVIIKNCVNLWRILYENNLKFCQ